MYNEMNWSTVNELIKRFEKDLGEKLSLESGIDVHSFPQTWGSTALGYDGIGGSAMTTAQTIVLYNSKANIVRVYFGSDRLAYQIDNPTEEFFKDLDLKNIKSVQGSEKYNKSKDKKTKLSEAKDFINYYYCENISHCFSSDFTDDFLKNLSKCYLKGEDPLRQLKMFTFQHSEDIKKLIIENKNEIFLASPISIVILERLENKSLYFKTQWEKEYPLECLERIAILWGKPLN